MSEIPLPYFENNLVTILVSEMCKYQSGFFTSV